MVSVNILKAFFASLASPAAGALAAFRWLDMESALQSLRASSSLRADRTSACSRCPRRCRCKAVMSLASDERLRSYKLDHHLRCDANLVQPRRPGACGSTSSRRAMPTARVHA